MELPINQILNMDCIEAMQLWPAESVHCCITSPPYWGLRDYGVDGQIGLEKTPEEYVAKMVDVFREVKRVLRKDGTLWLNLGDSYTTPKEGCTYGTSTSAFNHKDKTKTEGLQAQQFSKKCPENMRPKNLVGIPWRVAFALQQDGWYLRQDIIWHKPNPMPESVTDRCTKSHEYIFLLTKSARYFYDNEAVKEEADYDGRNDTIMKQSGKYNDGYMPNMNGQSVHARGHERWPSKDENGVPMRNRRSVWTVPTHSYKEAHFATFPPKLIEPCVLAGTSEKGCCAKCGAFMERVVDVGEKKQGIERGKHPSAFRANLQSPQQICGGGLGIVKTTTLGFRPTCQCNADTVPCVVLDPFMGSGTTAVVAYNHGRNYVGCELNPKYCKLGRVEKAKENYQLLEAV